MKRRIFFFCCARSEYDLLIAVVKAAAATPLLEPEVIASGALLSPFHGMGVEEIQRDNVKIAGAVESMLSSESWQGKALSFAQLMQGLTYLLSTNRPDILFVVGDRDEPLAAALVAIFLGIPVAHLHGGDRCITSDLDELWRPAISKLAHLHFTATESHRQRLIRMGEYPDRVWTTGGAGLDRLREAADVPDEVLSQEFGIDVRKPFYILIQHPSSALNPQVSGEEMREILRGILSLGYPIFCGYPNHDPGNVAIRQAIDEARAGSDKLIVYHNLPRDRFVALYRRCTAIVGNSSSIVIESGFLKVPGILLGPRQDLRERGPNVIRVEISAEDVKAACLRALEDEQYREMVRNCPSLYGDGHSAQRIVNILAEIPLSRELLLKTMTY
ncbi:MAG TPA: UDP-N-acetylglucosamine 2-epimerase [Thermoguttaceae bacterium]